MKKENGQFWLLALAAVLPYLLYGFQYFPVLDDYIQYWGYPAYQNPSLIFFHVGTLSTRPLASILDVTFWGEMWGFLPLALLLITAMLLAAGWLLGKTVERAGVQLSPLFYLILFLLPVGMEARFWLSASTRVVVGLFFASLSLYVLSGHLFKKSSLWRFLLFALLQLASCGFYESVAVFSVGGAILLWLSYVLDRKGRRHWFVPVTSVVNIGLMFAYYRIFAGLGALGSRASGMTFDNLGEKILSFFAQLGEIFAGFYNGIVLGAKDGLVVLCKAGFWGFFLLVFMLAAAYFIGRLTLRGSKMNKWQVLFLEICGLLLFFAPLVPNLLAETVWLTNRSIFVSLIGLALMLEPLVAQIPTRGKKLLFGVLALVLMLAAVNEYDVYHRVHEQDMALIDRVIAKMDTASKMGDCETAVLLPSEVKTEQNALYKDHVKSVFGADWSLTGAVRARMGSLAPQMIYPVLPGESYTTENTQVIDLTTK